VVAIVVSPNASTPVKLWYDVCRNHLKVPEAVDIPPMNELLSSELLCSRRVAVHSFDC